MLSRFTAFLYGVVCYVAFVATFLYAIGFLGNIVVPKSIDSGPQVPFLYALAINSVLLGVFAVQHSVMARPWFKKAWTRIAPEPVERSTYVLLSSLAMWLLFWKWQPMGGMIWSVQSQDGQVALQALYGLGALIVLATTFLINHFDLFGLRQVWLYLRGIPYTPLGFRTPAVPACQASVVCGMAGDVLVDSGDDGGTSGVCYRNHCIHIDCDSVRGA